MRKIIVLIIFYYFPIHTMQLQQATSEMKEDRIDWKHMLKQRNLGKNFTKMEGLVLAGKIPCDQKTRNELLFEMAIHSDNTDVVNCLIAQEAAIENSYIELGHLFWILYHNHFNLAYRMARSGLKIDHNGVLLGLCQMGTPHKDKKEKAIQWLLKKKIYPIRDSEKDFALSAICYENDLNLVKIFIKNKIPITADHLCTAIIPENSLPFMIFLLESGAHINAANPVTKTTVLHAACKFNKSKEIIATLLRYGADKDRVDEDGKKPVDYVTDPEIKALLESDLLLANA